MLDKFHLSPSHEEQMVVLQKAKRDMYNSKKTQLLSGLENAENSHLAEAAGQLPPPPPPPAVVDLRNNRTRG